MEATDLPLWYLRALAITWGLLWGSFANVMIYRWPRELSLVHPGSACPACGKPVRWYDNVPVLGWLWLRGKCRDCKSPISARYPFVEALYGVAAFAVCERLLRTEADLALGTFGALFFLRFAFVWGLLTASLIDLATFLLPDVITITGTVAGLAASAVLPGIGLRQSAFGAALGFGVPFAFYFVWSRFLKREGMGLGDAKLLAMVGALLGPQAVLFALSAGALQGLAAITVSRLTGWKLGPDPDLLDDEEDEEETDAEAKDTTAGADAEAEKEASSDGADEADDPGFLRTPIPFGPFLALGALEYMFVGDVLVGWWLRLLGA